MSDVSVEQHAASVSVMRDPHFRRLWAGQTVSLFGSRITDIALPLTAVLTLHATPIEMGFLVAADTAPNFIIGLPAGVWVDRMRRRRVMIASDVGRAVLLVSIPITAWMRILTITQLFVVAALVGTLNVFYGVAYQAYLPSLIPADRLNDANGKIEASGAVAQVSAPGLGGALVQLLTAPIALIADACSFAVSALMLGSIRAPEPVPVRSSTPFMISELMEGVRVTLGNAGLRSLTASAGTFNLFDGMLFAVYVLYMTRTLHLGAGAVGLVFGLGGVGGITGALIVGRFTRRVGLKQTVMLGILLASGAEVLIAGASGTALTAFVVLVVAETAIEFGATLYGVNVATIRQTVVPDHLRGRVNATYRVLVLSPGFVGSLSGGVLGQVLGLRWTVAIAGLGTLLSFLWILFSPIGREGS